MEEKARQQRQVACGLRIGSTHIAAGPQPDALQKLLGAWHNPKREEELKIWIFIPKVDWGWTVIGSKK